MGDDDRQRDDAGRFTAEPTVSDTDLLAAVAAEDGAAGTAAISKRVPLSRQQTFRRLRALADRDDPPLEALETGSAIVWRLVDPDE